MKDFSGTSAAEQLAAIRMEPIIYPHLQQPYGWLSASRASHALWYYYLCAMVTYDTVVANPLAYEGEKDPQAHFRQLIESIAKIYGVEVGSMVQAWGEIDMQCTTLGMPHLPDDEKYRFNR